MTLYEFNLLNENDQWKTLAGKGVLLTERKEDNYFLVLFQVDGFYIEVKYHTADRKMFGLRSFSSTDALAPYLEKIHIPQFI